MSKEIATNEETSILSQKFTKFDESSNDLPEKEDKPKDEYPQISFLQLYRYATALDKFNFFIAAIFCIVTGICNTLVSLTFGDITGDIVNYVYVTYNTTNQTEINQAKDDLNDGAIWFVTITSILGALTLVGTYISTVLFNYSALRQTYKIRNLFLAKVLDQDIPWYDLHQTGDFASRVAEDLKKFEDGIGEKVATFLYYQTTCVACILQGLIIGWELALICLVSFPITTITMGTVAWVASKLAKQEMEAYGAAGTIAEETLSSIRTVVAFDGQAQEEKRYNDLLLFARDNNIKRSLFTALSNALMWFFTFASYSLAFWYGVKLILKERDLPPDEITYDAGTMVTVFFSILTGSWYFGMGSPYIEIFGIARGAASKIFGVIATTPTINASKGVGVKPEKIEGNISFDAVHFHYPSRPDVTILRGFSLNIKPGETVALVGSSGCGKSTCVQLIQRYYDPEFGNVFVDGINIKEFDLTWLRSNIGVVGQEPVLFQTTIAENIRFGCPTATQADIEKAAKKANAHSFISLLPQGYDTMVGERGAQLSGGQKQRIAIARALVKEPAILLLDEATSALDTNSEAIVQAALDAASNECTTIIVAHRLSTVRKADRIVVISDGQVVEDGPHDQLMSTKGAYFQLVNAQVGTEEEDDEQQKTTNSAAEEPPPLLLSQLSVETVNGKRTSYARLDSNEKIPEYEEEKISSSSSLWVVMKLNSPEWWIITIGCLSSIVTGASMPIYSVVFGDILGVISATNEEYVREETNKYSLYFLIIGIATGVATFLQWYTFGVAGEKLTMRLRSRMFKAILAQEIAWFDDEDHGVGALCAQLSGEAASVQGATGQRIGTVLNALATIILALAISLSFEWRVSLVALCFVPLMLISIFYEQKVIQKENAGHHKALMKSTKLGVEAISNIRTVASLTCESKFHELYMSALKPYQKAALKNTHFRGIVYGVSRSLMFFGYSAALYYGITLIIDERLDYSKVFVVSECLLTGSWSIANALAFTPNFQKGLIAANRIFKLLNRETKIQNGSSDVHEKWTKGNIEYNKIFFSYPTRSTTQVLKGLDLSVLQGKMVALVGPSGCGKSTIVQLLERFYDPNKGTVTADGKDIRNMNLSALRSHLGIVSQEPNLFSKTIAENIAYGDNSRTVTQEEVIDAAKKANIHNFITSLPLGYETKLGEKGTQLSGGQKQRVAIARALIRNPKVLLLDEATSALDAESEKVVQEALDNAKVGRTCISIAHRLTTIQDADVICVINHGRVAEMGTHQELLALKGIYHNLYSIQSGHH